MSEIGKKLNYPGTKQIGDPATQRYARKLTRTLDDLKAQLMRSLKTYIDELIKNINIEIGTLDHGGLTGLPDIEDHLYAFLIDASRAFTGHGPGFSNDTSLTDASMYAAVSEYAIKAYVDALLAYILASPTGSIVYIWEDWEDNKYIERLIPGQYGQVLTTGGANQKPFWSWVWEEPGADFGGRIYFRVWMSAYVQDKAIIAMDVNHLVTAGGLDVNRNDSIGGPYTERFETRKAVPSFDIEVSSAIISMTKSKQISDNMTSSFETLISPLLVSVFDNIGITDETTASVPLVISAYDTLVVGESVDAVVI